MSSVIRIGTRDSELALWQANVVKSQLEALGYQTTIIPIKSTGDLVLDKPLYELGITGIFTRSLDIAMLNEDIDIAVHSLKDVPTVLPKGIIQAAVLKRGNVLDTLVFKNNEEFLSAKHAVIATGSLRRRAQWLNRYPTHTVENLRGNVNSRLQKLESNSHWNGAIFAAAGIGRIGIRPEKAINLEWMIPAPGQGAIMITALADNDYALTACAQLNDRETEICTYIERTFLNKLEGGCTAPIGALAYIKNEDIIFKGVLLSPDGTKRIDVTRNAKLSDFDTIAEYCARFVIDRGGKHLMDTVIKKEIGKTHVYSTKDLTNDQNALFLNTLNVESSNFIKINFNRISPRIVKNPIEHVIITSKNAVEALLYNFSAIELQFKHIYCVGRRTKRFIESKLHRVTHFENSAKALSKYIVSNLPKANLTYFCSNISLDDLPKELEKHNIALNKIEVYETKLNSIKVNPNIEGVLFFSPSTVQSFITLNNINCIAFCIGESTATEARKYFTDVRIAAIPTVESVIELVNKHYVS